MTRRTWAVAILGAWAASLGWLVKREFFRPTGTRLAEAALSVPPGAVYYRLDVGGRQVGFASSTIDTQATSIGVTDMLVLRTPALGVLHRSVVLSRASCLAPCDSRAFWRDSTATWADLRRAVSSTAIASWRSLSLRGRTPRRPASPSPAQSCSRACCRCDSRSAAS